MLLTVIDGTSESISTLLRCNRRSLFTTLESHLLEYSLHYNSILLSFNFCKSLTTNLIISIMKKRRWYPLDSNPGPQVSKDGKQRRIQWAMSICFLARTLSFHRYISNRRYSYESCLSSDALDHTRLIIYPFTCSMMFCDFLVICQLYF